MLIPRSEVFEVQLPVGCPDPPRGPLWLRGTSPLSPWGQGCQGFGTISAVAYAIIHYLKIESGHKLLNTRNKSQSNKSSQKNLVVSSKPAIQHLFLNDTTSFPFLSHLTRQMGQIRSTLSPFYSIHQAPHQHYHTPEIVVLHKFIEHRVYSKSWDHEKRTKYDLPNFCFLL